MRDDCSPHLATRGPAAERQWTTDQAGKTVSGLHGSAVLAQCGSADVGPIKYGRACPVPRRRGRPGRGPLWEFEIGPPLGQRDIAVWVSSIFNYVEILFQFSLLTPSQCVEMFGTL